MKKIYHTYRIMNINKGNYLLKYSIFYNTKFIIHMIKGN